MSRPAPISVRSPLAARLCLPSCGKSKAWELQTKPWTYECAGCGKQTSVTAGTIMHHSKLPLTTWFWAAYLIGHPLQWHLRPATAAPTRLGFI